jgi:hypothetical protein
MDGRLCYISALTLAAACALRTTTMKIAMRDAKNEGVSRREPA